MASTSGIPVATFAIDGRIADLVRLKLLPEYDVVHICTDLPAAKSELSRLLSGDLSVTPSSGYGTNMHCAESEKKIPKAVLRGAGISDEQLEELRTALKGVAEIKYVQVTKEDLTKGGCTVERPDADWIAKILKEKLPEALA